MSDNLRPEKLDQMIGQENVRSRLAIAINAAINRKEALDHILFDGPPGLGKTTLALCIANSMGVKVQIANAAAFASPRDVLPFLMQAEGGVIFIDEVHRLPIIVEEFLYPALEDFRIDMVAGDGVNAKVMNLPLKPFTFIGATTRAGMLSAPLRDRCRIRETLDFYSVGELAKLVQRNAKKLGVYLPSGGAERIARCSRGTPRIANNRLRWMRDFGVATNDQLTEALTMLGIDEHGMESRDRKYLDALKTFGGGPIGVAALAHTLSVDEDTISNEIEPYLLRQKLITRTPRGRKLVTA
jgi:Holliday junction DNA helicase RuvB